MESSATSAPIRLPFSGTQRLVLAVSAAGAVVTLCWAALQVRAAKDEARQARENAPAAPAPGHGPASVATSGPNGAFFMGDPQTVADKIKRVGEQLGGVDRLSLQMTNPRLAHADLLRGIELLGTEVAPLVASV